MFGACAPAGEGVKHGTVSLSPSTITSLRGTWTLCLSDSDCREFPVPGGWIPHGLRITSATYKLNVKSTPGMKIGLVIPRTLAAYEVYWNHSLAGKSGKMEDAASSYEALTKRLFLFPESAAGEDLLEIRVAGIGEVGGVVQPEIYAGPAGPVSDLYFARRTVSSILAGVFLFAGFSHLLFYFSRPKQFPYLYYSIACLLSTVAMIAAEGITYLITPSGVFNTISLTTVLALMPPATLLFVEGFFGRSQSAITYVVIAAGLALCAVLWTGLFSIQAFVFVVRYFLPVLMVFMLSSYFYIVYLVIRALISGQNGAVIVLSSLLLFILGFLNDFAVNRGYFRSFSLSGEGYLCFITGMSIALARQFALFQREHDQLHRQLESSENNYRSLVEGSGQMIFALDLEMRVTSANQACRSLLGMDPRKLIGKPFSQLVHASGHLESWLAGISTLMETRKPVRFSAVLATSLGEPRAMDLTLEYANSGLGDFILGKASGRHADEIQAMCEEETQYYVMSNYIVLAELLSRRLTAGIEKTAGAEAALAVEIGLRELLVNAVEHGNLEISFEEKSGLQREGKYYEALRQKQLDPVLGARKVHIQYEFKGNEFKAVIRDEGKGFDHKKQAQIKVAELGQLQHGRGLLLARAEFDSVTYNDAGNAVTVTKKFASAPESGLH